MDISYWLAISQVFCENCDSEVAVHLFMIQQETTLSGLCPSNRYIMRNPLEAEREPYLECYEVSRIGKKLENFIPMAGP